MSHTVSAFMPFVVADYLADTMHLSTLEHGAYLLLILHYWRHAKPLPDARHTLANIARLPLDAWDGVAPVVRTFFREATVNAMPVLIHNRIERELCHARGVYEQRKNASAAATEARKLARDRLIAKGILNESKTPHDTPHGGPSSDRTATNSHKYREQSSPSGDEVKPARRVKAKTSIPANFPLREDREWAIEHWLSKDRADLCDVIAEEVLKFRDHHTANDTRSADWPASWRTWAQNAVKFNKPRHVNGTGTKPTAHENLQQGTIIALERLERRGVG